MAIYTCVLLDIDNTLLDFDAAERQALTDMLAEYELPRDEHACAVYHQVNRELWDALAKGQMNKQKLFQVRFGRFMQAMQLPDNGKGKAMNDRYEELLSTHADLLPGAPTALLLCRNPALRPPASTAIWTASISLKKSAQPSPVPSCLSMPCVIWASRTAAAC